MLKVSRSPWFVKYNIALSLRDSLTRGIEVDLLVVDVDTRQPTIQLGAVDVHLNLMTVAAMEMSAAKLSSVLQ